MLQLRASRLGILESIRRPAESRGAKRSGNATETAGLQAGHSRRSDAGSQPRASADAGHTQTVECHPMSKMYHEKRRRLILMPDGMYESTNDGMVKLDDISKKSLAEAKERMKQDIDNDVAMFNRLLDNGHLEKAIYMIESGKVDRQTANSSITCFLNRKDSIILHACYLLISWIKSVMQSAKRKYN